jgi:hypothetical protein
LPHHQSEGNAVKSHFNFAESAGSQRECQRIAHDRYTFASSSLENRTAVSAIADAMLLLAARASKLGREDIHALLVDISAHLETSADEISTSRFGPFLIGRATLTLERINRNLNSMQMKFLTPAQDLAD